jgi:hypothetical protein
MGAAGSGVTASPLRRHHALLLDCCNTRHGLELGQAGAGDAPRDDADAVQDRAFSASLVARVVGSVNEGAVMYRVRVRTLMASLQLAVALEATTAAAEGSALPPPGHTEGGERHEGNDECTDGLGTSERRGRVVAGPKASRSAFARCSMEGRPGSRCGETRHRARARTDVGRAGARPAGAPAVDTCLLDALRREDSRRIPIPRRRWRARAVGSVLCDHSGWRARNHPCCAGFHGLGLGERKGRLVPRPRRGVCGMGSSGCPAWRHRGASSHGLDCRLFRAL